VFFNYSVRLGSLATTKGHRPRDVDRPVLGGHKGVDKLTGDAGFKHAQQQAGLRGDHLKDELVCE
jgi:hypothetical protein